MEMWIWIEGVSPQPIRNKENEPFDLRGYAPLVPLTHPHNRRLEIYLEDGVEEEEIENES